MLVCVRPTAVPWNVTYIVDFCFSFCDKRRERVDRKFLYTHEFLYTHSTRESKRTCMCLVHYMVKCLKPATFESRQEWFIKESAIGQSVTTVLMRRSSPCLSCYRSTFSSRVSTSDDQRVLLVDNRAQAVKRKPSGEYALEKVFFCHGRNCKALIWDR